MTTRGFVTMLGTFAFAAVISLSAFAQAPAGQEPGAKPPGGAPPSQAPAGGAQKGDSAKGELKSVDAAKMTLTLASGESFMYTDQTKVTGAQGGVAGLASASGRQGTINFTTKGADNIATSIEVAAK